jgi:hypothetical protein
VSLTVYIDRVSPHPGPVGMSTVVHYCTYCCPKNQRTLSSLQARSHGLGLTSVRCRPPVAHPSTRVVHPLPLLSLSMIQVTSSILVYRPLPIRDMIVNHLGRRIHGEIPPNRLHEVALRIHQVKVDAVIHQVILSRLDVRRRGEVDPVRFAHVLYFLPSTCHAQDILMEFRKVSTDDLRCISRRVTGYEDGE